MRIHCHKFGHWKDTLICSMSCPHTFRCKQFAKWRKENEEALQKRIMEHVKAHPDKGYEILFIPIKTKKREVSMSIKRYACIQEDSVAVLTEEEITQQLIEGEAYDEIFELGRKMEIQIRLVPVKKEKSSKDESHKEEILSVTGRGRKKKNLEVV